MPLTPLSLYTGDGPIHRAALAGRSDIVSLLLDRGADVSALGQFSRNALMFAAGCEKENGAVVELLCAAGLSVNATSEHEKSTALTLACAYGTAGTVAKLLDVSADLEKKNGYGEDIWVLICSMLVKIVPDHHTTNTHSK